LTWASQADRLRERRNIFNCHRSSPKERYNITLPSMKIQMARTSRQRYGCWRFADFIK